MKQLAVIACCIIALTACNTTTKKYAFNWEDVNYNFGGKPASKGE